MTVPEASGWDLLCGDARALLGEYVDDCVDAAVTDPPYGLSKEPDITEVLTHWLAGDDYHHRGGGFMGKAWDGFVPGPAYWCEVLRVLKPGSFLAAFSSPRTYDLLAVAIRLAGFEIRDQLEWLNGQGMPKAPGVLKPGHEPIVLARKPFRGSAKACHEDNGTALLNTELCRIVYESEEDLAATQAKNPGRDDRWISDVYGADRPQQRVNGDGRWPTNVILAESVAEALGRDGRFFFTAKASKSERTGGVEHNAHPTVKPLSLMRWLVRLVTPPEGLVLDPFMGSGTTGVACLHEGLDFMGIDLDQDYVVTATQRIAHWEQELARSVR